MALLPLLPSSPLLAGGATCLLFAGGGGCATFFCTGEATGGAFGALGGNTGRLDTVVDGLSSVGGRMNKRLPGIRLF